ncbi:DUF2783 domain-containing protein [Stappia stellulata]|uniref:DUF2783 domain-containing protein n=1 Tax=Stappia stellulata TaxID=71235 RepID=UPI000408E494|nr:DUF2783 domain-containing protein [Stappia stellulata]
MTAPTHGTLTLEPNIKDPDGFYAELLAAHEGLSREDSEALNARLVLILANHVGDRDTIRAALEAALPER